MTIDLEILQFLHYHPLANRAEIMAELTEAPFPFSVKKTLLLPCRSASHGCAVLCELSVLT